MIQRTFLVLAMCLLSEFPALATEPDLDQIAPDEIADLEEFDFKNAEVPPRPRGFARIGQFRGGAFRNGGYGNNPFPARPFGDDTELQEFRGNAGRRQNMEYSTETGFVFVDGEFVNPLYIIETRKGELFVNSISLGAIPSKSAENMIPGTQIIDSNELFNQLSSDRVAVKFPERPVFCPDATNSDKLLAMLALDPQDRSAELSEFLGSLPQSEDRNQWSQWILNAHFDNDLSERIQNRANFLKETQEKTTRLLSAEAAMESFSYPLTLLGMIVVVLSVGYLLAFNPSMAQLLPEQMRAAQLSKSVRYSVILIVLMSALDLAWTILSSSVGLMNELNPVGSGLISDPVSLIKFKMGATLLAAALFLGMRKFRSAQLASWWMCIVLTLVSARWLVFNSMYMG